MEWDWQPVVDLNPRGYVELNDGKTATHGPVEKVEIDRHDNVRITTKWQAYVRLSPEGVPVGDWIAVSNNPVMIFPYMSETVAKGRRIRFAATSLLYIDEVEGLDPARVKGLVLPL